MLLELQNVGRRYGYRQALTDISLQIETGELICLLGPNGAGKSTLLRTIASRNPPEEGIILFMGQRVTTFADRRALLAHTAELSHQTGLLLDLSAYENLAFFLGLYRAREASDEQLIHESLARVGLGERIHDTVRSFSRGMRQRLALARIAISSPRLLLLDEPLTALDAPGQRLLFDLIAEARAGGAACLVAIHSEEMFADLATRFVYVRQGRIVADITKERWTEEARSRARSLLYS